MNARDPIDCPPSLTTRAPVMLRPAGEQRNTAKSAMSDLSPYLPSGIVRLSASPASGVGVNRAIPSVSAMGPGAIELILEEHQDWHMLVRPHHLPLA